ncbi:MAG: HAD family phosphatase, partial [Chloroflexi bacterium]|nr:HAD family phosphatase [Chloroflexota bacterium]
MSSYKLIAVDVDGTLLRSNGTVSDRTKQALSTAIERGHHLAVATGRRRRTARLVLEQLDLPYFLVASQGAAVWNDDEILFHSHLPVPAAHGVLRILQEHDMAAAILGNALQEDVIWVAGDWQANRRLSAYLSRNLQYVRPLENGALEHDPLELIVMDTMERLEQLNEALTGHPPPPPSPDAPAQPGPDECLPLWRVIFSRNQFTAGGAIEIVGPTT